MDIGLHTGGSAPDLRNSIINSDRTQNILNILREHPLVQQAFDLLQQKLPSDLYYHNLAHTEDVFEKAVMLGLTDGLDHNDLTLLAIAAAWHDTGFTVQKTLNEPIAANLVRDAMKTHAGFDEREINDVSDAILETQVQFDPSNRTLYQKCSSRLSPWLLDADLNNFGQPDFMSKSMNVYAEMRGKKVESLKDLDDASGLGYISTTLRLLGRHIWHSDAARKMFSQTETKNLANLGLLLAELFNGTETGKEQAWQAIFSLNS